MKNENKWKTKALLKIAGGGSLATLLFICTLMILLLSRASFAGTFIQGQQCSIAGDEGTIQCKPNPDPDNNSEYPYCCRANKGAFTLISSITACIGAPLLQGSGSAPRCVPDAASCGCDVKQDCGPDKTSCFAQFDEKSKCQKSCY